MLQLEQKLMNMISEEYGEGDKLPTEPELMKQFGVGRTVLRDILKSLELRGLIVSRQGSGRYVHRPNCSERFTNIWRDTLNTTPSLMIELLELRSILEISSLDCAMERVSVGHLQELTVQVQEMKRKAKMGEPFVEEDKQFHTIMFKGAGNIIIEQLLTSFWNLFEESGIDFHHGELLEVARHHEMILEVFTKKCKEQLTELMNKQFADAKYRIMVHLAKDAKVNGVNSFQS